MAMAYCRRPKRRLSSRSLVTVGSVLLLLGVAAIRNHYSSAVIEIVDHDRSYSGRRLLSVFNCTPPAIEQFPRDYFNHDQRHQGAFVLHVILAAYMFLALALVCDDYFVPSCERCCQVLKLQEDVAGATFMAAGSSAPELATAIIGVFIAKDDIGLGAVVGSAVFNIMFVISVCALCAGTVVYLKWWPLLRDCLFYTLSIIALVLVIMDEEVHWYEALAFLIMYALYIVLMYFNRSIEGWVVPKCPSLGHQWGSLSKPIPLSSIANDSEQTTSLDTDEWDSTVGDVSAHERESLLTSGVSDEGHNHLENNHVNHSNNHDSKTDKTDVVKFDMENDWLEKDDDVDHYDKDAEATTWVWTVPKSSCRRCLWVVSLPLVAVMFVTVPDCRQKRWKNWFIVTFILSIIWIGVFSYFMVWMITVVGHTWHIPDSVMGLTFIAAGSSVPDAIASLLVVRDGYGDMAVSNAVGSNVFDILLCLGLPWFLQTTVVDRNGPVQVYSAGLTYSSLTLLTTVIVLLVSMHINRWRLTKPYGVFLMIIYVLFNILSSLYELNIFGYLHPQECPSEF